MQSKGNTGLSRMSQSQRDRCCQTTSPERGLGAAGSCGEGLVLPGYLFLFCRMKSVELGILLAAEQCECVQSHSTVDKNTAMKKAVDCTVPQQERRVIPTNQAFKVHPRSKCRQLEKAWPSRGHVD